MDIEPTADAAASVDPAVGGTDATLEEARPGAGEPHDFFDPGELYPNLAWDLPDGTRLRSCRRCMANEGPGSVNKPCRGQARMELR